MRRLEREQKEQQRREQEQRDKLILQQRREREAMQRAREACEVREREESARREREAREAREAREREESARRERDESAAREHEAREREVRKAKAQEQKEGMLAPMRRAPLPPPSCTCTRLRTNHPACTARCTRCASPPRTGGPCAVLTRGTSLSCCRENLARLQEKRQRDVDSIELIKTFGPGAGRHMHPAPCTPHPPARALAPKWHSALVSPPIRPSRARAVQTTRRSWRR